MGRHFRAGASSWCLWGSRHISCAAGFKPRRRGHGPNTRTCGAEWASPRAGRAVSNTLAYDFICGFLVPVSRGTGPGMWQHLYELGGEPHGAKKVLDLPFPQLLFLQQTPLQPSELHSGSTSSRETPFTSELALSLSAPPPCYPAPERETVITPTPCPNDRRCLQSHVFVFLRQERHSGSVRRVTEQSRSWRSIAAHHGCQDDTTRSSRPPSRPSLKRLTMRKKSTCATIPFTESSRTGKLMSAVRGLQACGYLRGQSD